MAQSHLLIVFGGLPGAGKTTLARRVAQHFTATYLRIDTIEQSIKRTTGIKPVAEGYMMAYVLAEENLTLGNTVIADSVNPVPATRAAWREVAERTRAKLVEVEVICSDKTEHQRRVQTRTADIPGHQLPNWVDVETREYHPWDGRHIVIDTAKLNGAEAVEKLLTDLNRFISD